MKQHLTVRGALEVEEVRRLLDRPLRRLRRRLSRFPPDAVQLRTLVREGEGPRAEATLTLWLPSTTLAVSEEGGNAHAALREAFAELERRLEKEKGRLRRSRRPRRFLRAFHDELVDRVVGRSPTAVPEPRAEQLRRDLLEMHRFVRRELRWLEASGDLTRGEIDSRDVVDAAFLDACSRSAEPPARERLLQAAGAALRAEVERARRSRQEVHIEDDAGSGAHDDGSAFGSGILDFDPEDGRLRVEDVLPGLGGTPEDVEVTVELAVALQGALEALPASWRQALLLTAVEQLEPAEVARALGVGADDVERLLANARAYLRDRLVETGLVGARIAHDAA